MFKLEKIQGSGNKTRIKMFEGLSGRKVTRLVFDSKELSFNLCMEVKVRKILKEVDVCQNCLEMVMVFLGKWKVSCVLSVID